YRYTLFPYTTLFRSKLSNLNNESIDYVFVDPPFGANIMYSELNQITESWLKLKTNSSMEAIENKSQNKGKFDYQNLMLDSFKERSEEHTSELQSREN